MVAPCVVSLEPVPQSLPQITQRSIFFQIHILVFQRSPKSLDENIIHPTTFPVHAHFDAQTLQFSHPLRRCELAALIRVEYLRQLLAVFNGLFQRLSITVSVDLTGDYGARIVLRNIQPKLVKIGNSIKIHLGTGEVIQIPFEINDKN